MPRHCRSRSQMVGRGAASGRHRSVVPQLEQLENRLVPALAVTDLTSGVTAAQLVQTIVGSGVAVSNIQLTAAPGDPANDVKGGVSSSAGIFTGGTGIIGFDSGIVLSCGGVKNVIGPNIDSGITQANGMPGDPQLTALAGTDTFDATVLEFDFVPTSSTISFQYVFSSDEYNEFVGSFNDVFAFFLNGQNIALIPGTTTPVSINDVNLTSNSQFYVDNDIQDGSVHLDTEMDGLTVVLTATATVTAGQTNHIKLAIADAGDDVVDSNVFIKAGSFSPPPPPPPINGSQFYAVGADAGGGPEVKVYNSQTNALVYDFYAYDSRFTGGVRVAVGDVTGDGVDDIVTAAGPGGGPQVNVYDGATGALLAAFYAYDPRFAGGVFVAVGDVNGDGHADIITGAGAGGGPHVEVWDGATGTPVASFMAYNPSFSGGVHVAAGDLDGDGVAEVVTGAGPGGGPHVRAFEGDGTPFAGAAGSFYAYDPRFLGGVFVAVADTDGDGRGDIITGAGPGGGPQVNIFDGPTGALIDSFLAGPGAATLFNADGDAFRGGVRVAAVDLPGNGHASILTGFGPPNSPVVQEFEPFTHLVQTNFLAFDAAFTGGVFVGGR